jgi:alkylhydroperoxidase/carboxymuconolactone decarboxylase family protein YurZ
MSDYLPGVYTTFRSEYPEVAAALDGLAMSIEDDGDLAPTTSRLVKLGIAIGAGAEGSVRSNVRKALDAGVSPKDIRHCGLLAITTVGFPAAIAAQGWIGEVLDSE